MPSLTRAELDALLTYNRDEGTFTWKARPHEVLENRAFNARFAGKEAGRKAQGYVGITIEGVSIGAHRLVWFYETGHWPEQLIDHIDGNPRNNHFSNLREATCKQNATNTGLAKNNTSGAKGVCWNKGLKKWQAGIKHNRQQIHLGVFDDFEAAVAARKRAENEYHGEWARRA